MALMSVKNLAYNKLARQNIFFLLYSFNSDFCCFDLLLSSFISLFLLLLSLSLSNLLFCYSYYILFLLQSSLLLFSVLSMLFILFYLILFVIVHITMTFVCMLRVTCMCLFLAIIVYIVTVIITTILFFSTLPVTGGRIQQLNSSGMVYPYPLITLGKPQGKYYFYFYFILFFL